MGNRSIALLSALAVLTAMPVADAKVQRNQQERAVFMKQYPCPSGRIWALLAYQGGALAFTGTHLD